MCRVTAHFTWILEPWIIPIETASTSYDAILFFGHACFHGGAIHNRTLFGKCLLSWFDFFGMFLACVCYFLVNYWLELVTYLGIIINILFG